MNLLDVWTILVGLVLALLVMGTLAPFEALEWWAGWYGSRTEDTDTEDTDTEDTTDASAATQPIARVSEQHDHSRHFVVFLSGIHSVSGESYAAREIAFLEALKARLPHITLVELFPYSVTNRALTGQRQFARVWRWALNNKVSGNGLAGFLINLRNLWQVAVSADRRYGPIYNRGSADMILKGLRAKGYPFAGDTPVTLIGYSGGGQIAVGAAPYLRDALGQPVQVISLGGVISADPGALALRKLYHLYGTRDAVQRLGNIMCPGRWAVVALSPWNQAKRSGIIRLIRMGSMDHTGVDGYLDADTFVGQDDATQLYQRVISRNTINRNVNNQSASIQNTSVQNSGSPATASQGVNSQDVSASSSNQPPKLSYLDVTLDTISTCLTDIESSLGAVPSPS
ncbi:MAG: hypothetical protein AAF708_03840 [Deinococcota bacterium]